MRNLITLALVAGLSTVAFADGNSDSATATAKAHIIAPVKIVSTANVDFGQIVLDDITQAASVVMTTVTTNDQDTSATLGTWDHCAAFKNNKTNVTGATFHYSHDVQASVNNGVKVTPDATVTLSGGIEGTKPVTLTTNSDMPAHTCALAEIKGQKELTGYVQFNHFGVGGKLNIPAGNLGVKTGTMTVKVEYI